MAVYGLFVLREREKKRKKKESTGAKKQMKNETNVIIMANE